MPRKSALTWILVMGLICLIGGLVKKEMQPAIIGAVIVLYAIISLATGPRKKRHNG